MNKATFPELITFIEPDDEPEYDSPQNSKWVVSVDNWGNVSILDAPNIHPWFFEGGENAECVGIPYDQEDKAPGVYEWICSYHQHKDWESGAIDAFEFVVEEEKLLWSVDNRGC